MVHLPGIGRFYVLLACHLSEGGSVHFYPPDAVTKMNPQVNKKLCCYWYEGEISLALEATCLKIPQRWASHWLPCRGGREKELCARNETPLGK